MRRGLSILLLTALAAAAWSQDTVRFANWELVPPPVMEPAREAGDRLVYRLPPAMNLGTATLTFHAPRRFSGPLGPWFEAEWKRLLAGRRVQEEMPLQEIQTAGGVPGLMREAALADGGFLHLSAWNPRGAVNLMVLETSSENATMMGGVALLAIGPSLAVYPLDGVPPAVASAGGPGAAAPPGPGASDAPQTPGPGPGPTPPGPDPYDSVDWDGPDVVVRSLFDARSMVVEDDLKEFLRLNRGLVGSVRPQPVDFSTAIARARGLLKLSEVEKLLAALGAEEQLATPVGSQAAAAAFLAGGREGEALAVLLAGLRKWPRDANLLHTLASLLLYHGQANEALAILEELERRRTLPDSAWGISSRSILDYSRGYALVMLGRTSEARSLIGPLVDGEPNMSEAALTMALIAAAGGAEPRELFIKGAWRHREDRMDHDISEDWPKDPYKDADAVVLDVTGYLDLSKGTPGVLPYVPGLPSFDLAPEYSKWVPRTMEEAGQKALALIEERDRKHDKWLGQTPDSAQKERMIELYSIFGEANAALPAIRVLMRERDRASEELNRAMDVSMEDLERFALQKDKDCDDALALSRRILARHRPYVDALERAIRRLHKTLHRYQTGLAAYVGDPLLREVMALEIKIDSLLAYADILSAHVHLYIMAPALECPPPPPPMPPGGEVQAGNPAECSDEQARYSVSAEIKVVGVEISCREASLEVTVPVFGPFGGLSLELGVSTKGEMTFFAGPKGDAQVASIKGGIYTKFDRNGINEVGYKYQSKVSGSIGPVKNNYTLHDEPSFRFVPGPAEPRPGALREYSRP